MAFQTKRDPLFDSSMQEAIEKRGKELIGLVLLVVGLALAALLSSYSPQDPSWMSASDAPVRNWLGLFGASIAAPLVMVIGIGGWALAALAVTWGLRFTIYRAESAPVGRLVFAPVFVVLLSVYGGTLNTGPGWPHAFGLGGLFGDTVLGALIGLMPLDVAGSLKLAGLITGPAALLLGLYVAGITTAELRRAFRWLVIGVVLAYALLRRVLGRGAVGAASVAGNATRNAGAGLRERIARQRAQREARAAAAPDRGPVLTRDAGPRDHAQEDWIRDERERAARARAAGHAPAGQVAAWEDADWDDAGWDDPDTALAEDVPADPHDHRDAPEAARPEPAARAPRVHRAVPPVEAEEPAPRSAPRRDAPEAAPAPHAGPAVPRHAPAAAPAPACAPDPAPRPRLLGRLTGAVRRAGARDRDLDLDQMSDEDLLMVAGEEDLPSDERIRAKIADVVRSRARRAPSGPGGAATAPRPRRGGRGPAPLVFDPTRDEPPLTAADEPGLPPEPPLTAPAEPPRPRLGGADPRHAGLAYPDEAPAGPGDAHAAEALPAVAYPAEAYPVEAYPAEACPVEDEAPYDTPEDHDPRAWTGHDAAPEAGDMPAPERPDATPPARDATPIPPAPREAAVPEADHAPAPWDAEEDDEADLPDPDRFGTPDPMVAETRPRIPVAEPRKVVQPREHKPVQQSSRARAEAQPSLAFDPAAEEFELPPLSLLTNPASIERHHLSDEALEENARMLENVLDDYGVKGEIVRVRPGPVVTMYELEPAPGLKASRVINLADDIARSMAALSARVSTVPGRSVIGIELPNDNREMVLLREILAARDFGDSHMKLPLALGKGIDGDAMVANLAKMPHLLIAGTTGSGKSVAINTMILSLLYKLTPEECRLIMIDPKMLELSVYDGIPHLLSPVVTDPKKAVVALKWVVQEMEERYRKMSKMGVRNIDGYNGRVEDALNKGETFSRTVQTGFDEETGDPIFETEEIQPEKMPYIVVIVDEMADLMMVAGKEIEACIQRLAQMARASGIHLIMATQRPSVDVITGTIKANFPTRISFQVTSKIDSRTILGEMGAEQLLGMGDMLYMAGGARITRCHGPFVSDEEVEEIVNYLKTQGAPDYVGGVVEGPDDEKTADIDAVLGLNTGGNTGGEDALYDQAVAIAIKDRKCSTSYIQRKLAIGYNKAARLVEQMEDQGVVSAANHVGKREVLVPEQ